MPFKYRSITANCGNDKLGESASKQIAQSIQDDDADFFVINCQEAHFANTQKQLEDQLEELGLGKEYKVECLSKMATHTKWDTQILPTTGMATFVICKKDLELKVEGAPIEARRQTSRPGAGYNKGGMVTNFSVTRNGGDNEQGITAESIKVQAVTGHLDAGNVVKRNQDWHNIYRASVKNVTNWDQLVDACPDLMLAGYDANTRNKLDDQGKDYNMWDKPPKDHPEIHALYLLSKAAAKYSKDTTYDHVKRDKNTNQILKDEAGKEIIADSKRKSEEVAARGMLDFVIQYDGNIDQNTSREKIDKGLTVVAVPPNSAESERDHYVIISPPQTSSSPSSPSEQFERVKNQMAARLYGVAPDIANKILKIKEGSTDQEKLNAQEQLVNYYKDYLGPNGFLDNAIGLHIRKLDYFQQITNDASLDKELKDSLKETLFGELEWCAGDPEQLKAKQELMHAFLDSLAQCEHATGIKACIDCYKELKGKIAANETINAADAANAFKNSAVENYQTVYVLFHSALEHESDEELKRAGTEILKKLNVIVNPADVNALKSMDPKKLDTLTHIVAQCHNSYDQLKDDKFEKSDNKINQELISLSHDAMGSSSPVWRALADAVKCFVSLISDKLANKIGIVQDKKLSDSVIQYKSALFKSALNDIIPQEENKESDKLLDERSGPPPMG